MNVAHLEALDELAREVQKAYDATMLKGERGDPGPLSVRDLDNGPLPDDNAVPRLELLQSWRFLISALERNQVFLQFTSVLHRLFTIEITDCKVWEHAKTLLHQLRDTVDNHDKDGSTECRFVTLMEIFRTFGKDWSPSEEIIREWDAFQEQLPLDMTAEAFRRSAYNVLMSLPWVPISSGLSEVCLVGNPGVPKLDTSAIDPFLFESIRGSPLPREDYVHQLLAQFDVDRPTSVAVRATQKDDNSPKHGLGKSTLVAMLASFMQAQRQFTVLWLRLEGSHTGDDMSCAEYIAHLDALCKQLGRNIEWPEQTRMLENTSFRCHREERRMKEAKRLMTNCLAQQETHIFLVLDDVNDDQQIEWFWFLEKQSLLLTTNASNLKVEWTLELDVLSEDEALDLFLTEADYPLDHVLSTSLEAQTIVERCGYHPLTIRTAARWFHLKQATAGVVKALEELEQELASCATKIRFSRRAGSTVHLLTEIMDLMLSPRATDGQPTTLMKLCLASMALVFQGRVPLDALHMLWGKLLENDPDAVNELGRDLTPNQIRKRVGFISDALVSLGILSTTEQDGVRCAEIHHELHREYAENLGRDMQVRNSAVRVVRSWHEAFAVTYLAKADADSGNDEHRRSYAINMLVFHLIEANMIEKAVEVLCDTQFIEDRVAKRGLKCGVLEHLRDCEALYRARKQEGNNQEGVKRQTVVSILGVLSDFLVSQEDKITKDTVADVAVAIQNVGLAFAEKRCLSKASSQYKSALKLVAKSDPVTPSLYYNLSVIDLQKNDIVKAERHIKSCFKAMAYHEEHAWYGEGLILKGDVLINANEYRGALKCFNQALEWFAADSLNNRMELGRLLDRKAHVLYVMGEPESALDVLGEAIETKTGIDESSRDLGASYKRLGDICSEMSNDDEAELNYKKALRIWEITRDKVDPSDILLVQGRMNYLRGATNQCFASFTEALKATKTLKTDDLCWFSMKYSSTGEPQKGIDVLREALSLTTDLPDTSLERATVQFNMASCYVAANELGEAMVALEESLCIRKRVLGEAEVIIQTLELMGDVHSRQGKIDEATACYNEALHLVDVVHGESDERAVAILLSLGEIKMENGAMDEGLDVLKRCLDLKRKHVGPNHPDLAAVLERLGNILLDQCAFDKAYKYHAECLKNRQANLDPNNPLLADSLCRMGVLTRKRGDCERALHFLLDALRIRTNAKDQELACDTLLEIGHVHRQSGDSESAAGCYKKCLEILVATLRYQSKSGGDVYLSLGHATRTMGNSEEALQNYEKALAIRKDILGVDHIQTGAVYRSLGIMEFQLGSYDLAQKYLLEFMRIFNDSKAKPTVDYVLGLLFLGDLYHRAGKQDAAKSSWSSALQAFQQKDISMKWPDLGPPLERRLTQLETATQPPRSPRPRMKREGSVFARLSADLVGRLSDEKLPTAAKVGVSSMTSNGSTRSIGEKSHEQMKRDPEEDEIYNSIFLDG